MRLFTFLICLPVLMTAAVIDVGRRAFASMLELLGSAQPLRVVPTAWPHAISMSDSAIAADLYQRNRHEAGVARQAADRHI